MRIEAAALWAPGGAEGLLDDLLAQRPRQQGRWQRAPNPARPAGVAAAPWRRMSRLSRAAVSVAASLLADRGELEQLAVVWGNTMGELTPIARFLGRLYTEGPQHVSPMAFQNSVTNAPAGHVSIALGLQGLSETISAAGATSLAALLRAEDLLRLGRTERVLVLTGDDLNPTAERAWDLAGVEGPVGEAVAGLLLGPGVGARLDIRQGADPLPDQPVFARRAALPGASALRLVPGSLAPEGSIGLVPSGGMAVLAALALAGASGSLVEQDDEMLLTGRLRAD